MLDFPYRLVYHVEFPAKFVLTDSVLEQYHDVFSILLLVRRAQMEAESAWAPMMWHRDNTGAHRLLESVFFCLLLVLFRVAAGAVARQAHHDHFRKFSFLLFRGTLTTF